MKSRAAVRVRETLQKSGSVGTAATRNATNDLQFDEPDGLVPLA
jgi:hypothetical protein